MFGQTIRQGERIAMWDRRGRRRVVEGPRRVWTWGYDVQPVREYVATQNQYLVVRFRDGVTRHVAGPAVVYFDPVVHEKVEVHEALAIDAGQAVTVYTKNDDGTVDRATLLGPARFVPGPNQWLRPQPLFTAGENEYLVVRFRDGRTAHVAGPTALHLDPVEHEAIEVAQTLAIDTHEAIVVYTRHPDDGVTRRVLRGPARFMPTPEEWVHEFCWHGADPRNPRRKIPRALQFTKLRVIPDQMYVDVEEVRTADDALLVVKLMLFFELADIDKMLDQTHDPVADFLNAVTADVIDFAGAVAFERFKTETDRLNTLEAYPNLTARAERIGYRVNKVVYRGYEAGAKLQTMHDDAIERRTKLKLEAETERQAQELEDLRLERETERAEIRRKLEREQADHARELQQVAHDERMRQAKADAEQRAQGQRLINEVELEHLRAKTAERAGYLRAMHGMQVDLTRYLVAQHQHPDRVIRIDGDGKAAARVHVRE